MKRIKLPKDVWLSLYKSLYDTIGHATRIKAGNNDDVRDEVLNIMNFYFDKNFDKVFNNVLEHENVEEQNCTGQKCKDCLACYKFGGTNVIVEKVKKY